MLVEPEHYKGISFVRISMLPRTARKIKESFSRELIVKILRDNTLINDCIVYDDYVSWYRLIKPQPYIQSQPIQNRSVFFHASGASLPAHIHSTNLTNLCRWQYIFNVGAYLTHFQFAFGHITFKDSFLRGLCRVVFSILLRWRLVFRPYQLAEKCILD